MDDICKNIEEYNPNKKRKLLIVFDMIADMLSNKKLNPIVTELFTRGRKLNISLFLSHNLILFNTLFCYENSKKKIEHQQIIFNHSSNIDFQDFMNLYKKCTLKPHFFLFLFF